jgi:hypothetical protein
MQSTISRRDWLKLTVVGATLGGTAGEALANELRRRAAVPMTVYKSPSCGCCGKWVDHMKAAGFTMTVKDVDDPNVVKREMGIPESLWSCHTGLVAGYLVEGHTPADVVHQLLKEKPKVMGIAVPGMPLGSPGMEASTKEKYNIMAFEKGGKTRVYASR